jgi:formylglycine-generating enzyme required for sulfatase activity
MKHFLFILLVIFISLATATCSPGKLFGPTFTPTPAITFTPGIGIGSTLERLADGMIMLYVPAGAFEMGSTRDMRLYAKQLCEQYSGDLAFGTCSLTSFANESPAHTVALKAFWIDRTEVTNEQYRQCVEAGACTPPVDLSSYTRADYFDDTAFDEYPVIWVDWHMVAAYCDWAGVRLPVEAEWEYAARGPDSLIFPWGDEFEPARLNYCDVGCDGISDPDFNDGFPDTAPVGSFPQGVSWIGALDMAGNVREWVKDLYGFYKPGQAEDPRGPQTGESRIPRGGSWYDRPDDTRSANRGEETPDYNRHNLGFRCVLGGGR